jgi:hypothetical protein
MPRDTRRLCGQSAKGKVVKSKSEIHTLGRESAILGVHRSNHGNSSGVSVLSLKFGSSNREGNHRDGFKKVLLTE